MIEKRISGGSSSSNSLNEIRHKFLEKLRIFLDDITIDNVVLNKKKVYLYDLYNKVTLYGGYYKINNDKIWKNVATELGVEFVGNTNMSASHLVKQCYELYLLDYEQTHNFPGIIKDLSSIETPQEKYKNIISSKSEQIRKTIIKCGDLDDDVVVNMNGHNNNGDNNDNNNNNGSIKKQYDTFQTCSVCGDFPTNYDPTNIILECILCGNRWHSKCHEPQVPLQTLQQLLNQQHLQQQQMGTTPPLNWTCTNCTIQRTAKFGYHASGNTYSLNEYKYRAKQLRIHFLKSLGRNDDLTSTEWENIFWSIVDNGCYPLSVEYGSEIPSTKEMTGFPMEDNDDGIINYGKHEFNLMNIKNAKGNILVHLGRDISGMTYPWIYVGMLFTAFGWHYEDHYAYSVNYNHYGGIKQWYGISGLDADSAENAMNEFLNKNNCGSFEQFDLVTLVSPLLLNKTHGIPIYKAQQKPGEFIVTFPQSYHCGFNIDFNIAEAVNFATSDWLSFGLKCTERYRIFGRRQAFSHDELICKLCQRIEILDLQTLKWLFESYLFIYKSHYEFIKTMLSANVTRGRPWEYDPNEWIKIKKNEASDSLLLFDNLDNLDKMDYIQLQQDGTGRMRYDDNILDDYLVSSSDDDDVCQCIYNCNNINKILLFKLVSCCCSKILQNLESKLVSNVSKYLDYRRYSNMLYIN